jgi:hypothetical protein
VTDENFPNFRRGGKAAEEAANKQGANKFVKTRYLDLKDGESILLRFIDDSQDWLSVNQHNFTPTKGASADASDEQRQRFPKRMTAVCRYDEAFGKSYPDCYICDHMTNERGRPMNPGLRVWARAVEREEIIGTQEMVDDGRIKSHLMGTRVGFRDVEVDEPVLNERGEVTGRTELRKKIIVLNLGVKNFFGPMQGYHDIYKTVLDREYHVTRKGAGTETDYRIVSMDPTPDHDLRDPETKERYLGYCRDSAVNVPKMILDRSTDDYYARYFDPRREPAKPTQDSAQPTAPVDEQAKPAEQSASKIALQEMKNRVLNQNQQADKPAGTMANFQ